MPGQLSLAGFEPAEAPADRLFFAILPDAPAVQRIERLARTLRASHGLTGRPLGARRFHVSLHHVGDFAGLPQDVVDAAVAIASGVVAAPFELAFDRVASFSRRSRNAPLVLLGGDGVLAVTAFQRALGTALAAVGLGRSAGAHFTPHLTLLYDGRPVGEQSIETIAWTAREFVLVHSFIGQSRHETLAHLPLRG